MQAATIRIGTRGSPLALAQAKQVQALLASAHGPEAGASELFIIKTSGDAIQDRPLSEAGGKGLFTKEIEEALLDRRIDLAVHSTKDVETSLPPGLTIAATLPREDPRDAFISLKYKSLDEMPAGARVGTSSLRRQAQVLNRRPDLEIVQFRGNVQTRLRKLEDGVADATFLACAGLNRLGLSHLITQAIPVDVVLPAVAQGAICLEIRADDEATARRIAPLNDPATALCIAAERMLLATLDGSCRTPIGGLALLADGKLHMRAEILSPDGKRRYFAERSASASEALRLGEDTGRELLSAAGPDFFRSLAS